MAQVIVNPDVDGVVYRRDVDETFSTIVAGAGTHVDKTTTTSLNTAVIGASATTNQYASLWRGVFIFDTSSIPVGSTIDSATFEYYVEGKADGLGGSHEVALCDGVTASNSDLVASDFQTQGTTKQATNLTIAGITTSAYNTWTLNATGLSNITAGGFTKLGLRIEKDRANVAPSWSSLDVARIYGTWTGSANEPKLTVNYTPPSVAGSPIFFQ